MGTVQIALGMAARLPQIYSNHARKNTGELAFLTFFLSLGGCGARFLTTLVSVPWEKGKLMMMAQFFVAALLNFIVVAQIVLYTYVKNGRLVIGRWKSAPILPTHLGHHHHHVDHETSSQGSHRG